MNQDSKITQRHPMNDAQPSQQTADAVKNGNGQNHKWRIDELICQLVDNCVQFASKQFEQNLSFNNEVLTNILYDNIKKLLSDKLDEDKFTNWVADELVKRGCVFKNQEGTTSDKPKVEVVEAVSAEEHQELVDRVTQAIALLKTQRTQIFRIFSDVDGQIKQIDEQGEYLRRDHQITTLVDRIKDNQDTVQKFDEQAQSTKTQLQEKIDILSHRIGVLHERQKKQNDTIATTLTGARTLIDQTRWGIGQLRADYATIVGGLGGGSSSKPGIAPIPLGKGRNGLSSSKQQSIAYRLGRRIGVAKTKLGNRTSSSFIGKTWRAVKKALKFAWGAVKKVGRAIKKVTNAFVKPAMFVGKAVVGAAKAIGRGVKSAVGTVRKMGIKKALTSAANNFAPGKFITKLGWKAIKFVGKKLWAGIKKLAFNAFQFFARLFGFMGKFVNKVGNWMKIIGAGIADKAYRFLVQPIATMLTTIFGFVTGVVMSPINFMKQLVSSVVDRIRSAMDAISSAAKKVLRATMGIFKRVLFSPLTYILLIGGIFFLFRDRLLGWLTGMVGGVRRGIVSSLAKVSSKMFTILSGLWEGVSMVGKFIFKVVDWITNPKGIIAKFVVGTIKTFLMVKTALKKLMQATGKSSIDILCMFLAGDTIGLAIHAISGGLMVFWKWIRDTKFMRWLLGIVNAFVAVGKLVFSYSTVVWRSLAGGMWQIMKGNFGGVIDAITGPWKDLWEQIKGVFSGKVFKASGIDNETIVENPIQSNDDQAKEAGIAVRGLGMKGKEDSLAHWNKYQSMFTKNVAGDIGKKMTAMNDIYQKNSQIVSAYNEFLEGIWTMGGVGANAAQQVLKLLLEDADNSQKLLSAFFYYNPQTGQTMQLRPTAYIEQFLNKIRLMMSDPDRDDFEAFKKIFHAFEQVNMERSHIVNNQGKVIADMAEKLSRFNTKVEDLEANSTVQISEYIKKLNNGNLFDAATARQSFQQISEKDAKTKRQKSITGEELGTSDLLKIEPIQETNGGKVALKDSDFVLKQEPDSKMQDKVGQIEFPKGSNPPPPQDTVDMDEDLLKKYYEHQEKRGHLLATGHTEEQVSGMGYKSMTFQEFRDQHNRLHPKTPEQIQKEREDNAKRSSALRLSKMASAYHSQGSQAGVGFDIGKKPSILQVDTDGLSKELYMFSPEWVEMNNAANISEDELALELNAQDRAAAERIRKKKEQEEAKRAEEERQRKREQEILDYSAKISSDGFIEVKIGEDETTMQQAWYLHEEKRREMLARGYTAEQADQAGLHSYTWSEWKRYYRKMHGMPEDGIKRIPLGVERKQRKIDWSARYPMSVDELAQYGIEMSEGGPVMIPLDKAMKAAGSLLQGAKTIYAVRDGLEVMRQGLATETSKLKERNKNGMPVAVAVAGGDSGGEQTTPVPDANSGYADVG